MAQKYKVTTETNGLNLRTAPNTNDDSNWILSIPKGAIVEETGIGVISPVDGWKYVTYNGKSGYASAQYLTPVDGDGKKQADPDKTTPVEDESEGKSYKGLLIAGAVVCVAGVALNIFI